MGKERTFPPLRRDSAGSAQPAYSRRKGTAALAASGGEQKSHICPLSILPVYIPYQPFHLIIISFQSLPTHIPPNLFNRSGLHVSKCATREKHGLRAAQGAWSFPCHFFWSESGIMTLQRTYHALIERLKRAWSWARIWEGNCGRSLCVLRICCLVVFAFCFHASFFAALLPMCFFLLPIPRIISPLFICQQVYVIRFAINTNLTHHIWFSIFVNREIGKGEETENLTIVYTLDIRSIHDISAVLSHLVLLGT